MKALLSTLFLFVVFTLSGQYKTIGELAQAPKGASFTIVLPDDSAMSEFIFDGNNWQGQGTTAGSTGFYINITGDGDKDTIINVEILPFLERRLPAGGNAFWSRGVKRPFGFVAQKTIDEVIDQLVASYQHIDQRGGVWRVNRDYGTSDNRLQLRSPNYWADIGILYPSGGADFTNENYSEIDFDFYLGGDLHIVGSFTKERILYLGGGPTIGDAINFVVGPKNVPDPKFYPHQKPKR